MSGFDVIAFDADDTLWYYERLYVETQTKIAELLAPYGTSEEIDAHLNRVELRNVQLYGYGIKGFALSMIEAAAELSDGRLSNKDVQAIIRYAKDMMAANIQLIEHVLETISGLSKRYRLAIITKGDLFEQETKISRSGLASYFRQVEIVGQKSSETYARILEKLSAAPKRFLMVGNSLRSDILPVMELGGHAVYIPSDTTWIHEEAEAPPVGHAGFYQLEHIGELPALLERIEAG
jgi:putative hydrolase of the HAD superfamily